MSDATATKMEQFSDLVGKTLTDARKASEDRIVFELEDGSEAALYHSQDCCESVSVEDIAGDLADLVGSPILFAEESVYDNEQPPNVSEPEFRDEDFRWTFYRIGTVKGTVVMRWYGSSNGYYSTAVDFYHGR